LIPREATEEKGNQGIPG